MAAPIDLDYMRESGFWSKVDRAADPAACWLWQQSCGSHGYGQTWDGITVRLAHRAAFELTFGRIPDGLTVDHVCRVRTCCNPAHLRLLTNSANGRLNGNAVAAECKRGHPFDPENTYVQPNGHRRCRQCRSDMRSASTLDAVEAER